MQKLCCCQLILGKSAFAGRVSEPERQRVPEASSEVGVGGEAEEALGHAATARPPSAAETTSADHTEVRQPRPVTGTAVLPAVKRPRFQPIRYTICHTNKNLSLIHI